MGAPFWLAARQAAKCVPALSHAVVAVLLRVAPPLSGADADAAPLDETLAPPLSGPSEELAVGAARSAPSKRGIKVAAKGPPSALFVSQATVLKLAESAARPRGAFVGQTGEHPPGLRLSGVASLGIGLQDGDILIEALGIAPRGPGEVIGAIIEARARNARLLSGTVWRQGQTFRLTVEQPYLRQGG